MNLKRLFIYMLPFLLGVSYSVLNKTNIVIDCTYFTELKMHLTHTVTSVVFMSPLYKFDMILKRIYL